ncbi:MULTISPECIES: hypothetical protein [Sphingomonas]|uniref:hypothetical protein n=1 Tax=Sphingomonas TaxID=13687 RepID=UPI000DF006D4|nr:MULTISPECIES: hypothetical protein [Sphingomonas]
MATDAAAPPRRQRKQRAEPLPESPNPLDIAMAAAAAGRPLPEVARKLLERQADLIHAQCTELRVREVGERVRAALWAVLAIAALGVVGLLVTLLVHAARSDALIVESFRVPPAMTQQGLSGEVVASQVLDRLAAMQAQTDTTRAASSYDNNWGDELKIDIPNTGATADQIWKLLRAWLGKETRISGEVSQTPAGLALTARVSGTPGQRFVSKTGDLDALVNQGAELIFRETQPYRYSIYVQTDPKRAAEAKQVLLDLTHDPSERERKWAYNGLSVTLRGEGDYLGSLAAANRALAIDPQMIPASSNVASAEQNMGHDQRAVDVIARSLALPMSKEYDAAKMEANRCRQRSISASLARDPVALDQSALCLDAMSGRADAAAATRLEASIERHDLAAALSYRPPPGLGDTPAAIAANAAFASLSAELLRGPSPALASALNTFRTAAAAQEAEIPYPARARSIALTGDWPLETEALVALSRLPEAAALIARTPLDCYTCVRDRGLVAEAMGNAREAQRWYAEAVRQAPRLAPAYADWGRLLGKVRHFDTADEKLATAIRLAPNWADPHKLRGDLFAAQGRSADATKEYDAALRLAPNWAAARQARATLARH